MNKDKAKLLVKTALGIALVYWVLHSKMVDFDALHSILTNPIHLLVAFAFILFSTLLCSLRWNLLANAQGLTLSYKDFFSLMMIGSFFNTFMPGSVGGDLIKAWYVAGKEPQRRTKAVISVIIDRILGLAVILLYAGITLMFYSEWISDKPQLHLLAYCLWGFTAACIIFGILFFIPAVWELPLFVGVLNYLKKYDRLSKMVDAFVLYRHHRKTVFCSVALSAISVLGINLMYCYQGNALGIEMTTAQYFFIVPIALTASAIPLLPGGIGTGQVAFYTLFLWIGIANPKQTGPTLCTLVQVYTILFNCLGAAFYLKYKRHPIEESKKKVPLTAELTPNV